jgi:hypothetical protein
LARHFECHARAFLPRLTARRRADNPSGRILPAFHHHLNRASSLGCESQSRVLCHRSLRELVHDCEIDLNDGGGLSAVAGARPDRPRSRDTLRARRHSGRFAHRPLRGHALSVAVTRVGPGRGIGGGRFSREGRPHRRRRAGHGRRVPLGDETRRPAGVARGAIHGRDLVPPTLRRPRLGVDTLNR